MELQKQLRVNFDSAIKSVEKAEDNDDLYITGYANTVAKDRAGDIIPKSAWEDPEAMANYQKNPIILAYHDHSQPIGKMVEFNVTELGLEIKAKISKGAGNVYNLIKDGILSTFSVGFGIKDAKYVPDDDTFYINKLELFEVSVVSVPCNQDSVFSVSKSMESADFEQLKTQLTPSQGEDITGKQKMSSDFEKLQAELAEIKAASANSADVAAAAAAKAIADAEAAKLAKAEKEAAEKAAQEARTAEVKSAASEAAKSLIEKLETELSKGNEKFGEAVKAQQEEIVALKDEIAQLNAARSKAFAMNPVAGAMSGHAGSTEERKNIGEVAKAAIAIAKDASQASQETDKVSNNITDLNEAIEETSKGAASTSEHAENLTSLAVKLKKATEQFKI